MDNILMRIYENYAGEGREMLLRAYDFAKEAHANQKRASGEPYFIHPCAVAEILIDLGLDTATVAGALLHDVIRPARRKISKRNSATRCSPSFPA